MVGSTYRPMYQVRFNSAYPSDSNEARVSQAVFHVPERSKYVLVAALTKPHGSDAGNVHDEESTEYELEFSDDEAEAAHGSGSNGSVRIRPSSPAQGAAVGVWAGCGTTVGPRDWECVHAQYSTEIVRVLNTQPYVSHAHQKSVLLVVGILI